jgi:magnesium transporter
MLPPEASMVLAAIDPDDRVDILEHVSGPLHEELMREFSPQDAADVRALEQYPPDTAGGIMTTQVTSLPEDMTVEQAIAELRRLQGRTGADVLCVRRRSADASGGCAVDARSDFVAPEMRLNQIMRPNVTSVPATMDQEEVARVMRKYKYLALPVVDARNRLIGLITVDDVVDVITEEATEDVQKMFGAGADERLLSPWQFSFKKRVWWLEVNLATAFLAAWVVSWFDDVIAAIPVLAAYQGIVSGMGGNAGAQALAVAIRGIALGESAPRLLLRVLYREFGLRPADWPGGRVTTWLCARCHIFGGSVISRQQIACWAAWTDLLPGIDAQPRQRLRHRRGDSVRDEKDGLRPRPIRDHFRDHLHRLRRFFLTLWLAKVIMHVHA